MSNTDWEALSKELEVKKGLALIDWKLLITNLSHLRTSFYDKPWKQRLAKLWIWFRKKNRLRRDKSAQNAVGLLHLTTFLPARIDISVVLSIHSSTRTNKKSRIRDELTSDAKKASSESRIRRNSGNWRLEFFSIPECLCELWRSILEGTGISMCNTFLSPSFPVSLVGRAGTW